MGDAVKQTTQDNGRVVKASGFTFERNGDEFAYCWSQHGVAIGIDQLHESHHELYGELLVRSLLPDAPAHVHWGHTNLSSVRTRSTLAKELSQRVRDVPWASLLETACTKTAIEYRRGEPTVDLSGFECPADAPMLVEHFMPEGEVTLIFGRGGSCKSLLALAIALAIKTKTSLPEGLVPNKQMDCLYLDWEAQRANQLRRIWALSKGFGWDRPPAIHYRPMRRPIWEEATKVRAEIDRLHIGLVIIDSIGYACVPEDINEAATALRAMGAARSLGVTVLVIAHVAKGSGDQKGNRSTPYGSIFFENSARSQWEIRRGESREEGVITFGAYHTKVNDGPIERPIGLEFQFYTEGQRVSCIDLLSCDLQADPELAVHTSLQTRLAALLKRGKKSIKELAEETGVKAGTVRVTLGRMKNVEKLDITHIDGSGYWGLRSN